MILVGIILAYASGYVVAVALPDGEDQWRWMIAGGLLFPVLPLVRRLL